MSNRHTLIARKEAVRARLTQTQRELERERTLPRSNSKRIRQMEQQLERLMAEEQELRQEIDRSE